MKLLTCYIKSTIWAKFYAVINGMITACGITEERLILRSKGHYAKKSRLQKTSWHRDYFKRGPGFSSKEKKILFLHRINFNGLPGWSHHLQELMAMSTYHIEDVSPKKNPKNCQNSLQILEHVWHLSHIQDSKKECKKKQTNKQTKATRGCHI